MRQWSHGIRHEDHCRLLTTLKKGSYSEEKSKSHDRLLDPITLRITGAVGKENEGQQNDSAATSTALDRLIWQKNSTKRKGDMSKSKQKKKRIPSNDRTESVQHREMGKRYCIPPHVIVNRDRYNPSFKHSRPIIKDNLKAVEKKI